MKPIVPEGGYFMVADWTALGIRYRYLIAVEVQFLVFLAEKYADLSEKRYPEKDYCFVEWLTRVKKLATIPPSAFYSGPNKKLGENYVRFCFIKVTYNHLRCMLKQINNFFVIIGG